MIPTTLRSLSLEEVYPIKYTAIEDREKLLLSFNMTDEVFLETPLQPLVEVKQQKNAFSWSWNFFVLNESTAMAIGNSHFDTWLLLEVCVKNSWIKLFTIELDSN
ncbi:hypothetical protein FH972_000036 [Carpinus fangiana]|uniref:F-box associated domain-containing protein n=1 Tax=Carpinus fangiana TaxID=176857 RepID=A0A5N6Q7M1_9ROSI|nr:hypothetical protein FH972_000036 [Carpinus fangiana]